MENDLNNAASWWFYAAVVVAAFLVILIVALIGVALLGWKWYVARKELISTLAQERKLKNENILLDPQITEEEILSFEFPVLVNCGHDKKIGAIIHELNRRNLNREGYGFCVRCNGYHSYEFSKKFCLVNNK